MNSIYVHGFHLFVLSKKHRHEDIKKKQKTLNEKNKKHSKHSMKTENAQCTLITMKTENTQCTLITINFKDKVMYISKV